VIVAVPERVFSYEGRERVFYKTRDGDTLDEIGEAFGVKADDLVEWNNLDATARLHPNMVVQIFVRKDFDPAGVVILDTARVRVVTLGSEEFLELEAARRGKKRLTYSCKAGDTLAKVGRRYGLTPGDLARINRFSYNTELHDGQRIVVYSPTGELPREVTMGLTPPSKRGKAGAVAPSSPSPSPLAPGAPSKSSAVGTRPATISTPVGGGVRRPPVALKTADKPLPVKAAPVVGAASKAPPVAVSKPPAKKK
jgi:LysM repeat protein